MFESQKPMAPRKLVAANCTRLDSSYWGFTFPWQEPLGAMASRREHGVPSVPQGLPAQIFLVATSAGLGLDEEDMVNWFTWAALGGGGGPAIAGYSRARPTV